MGDYFQVVVDRDATIAVAERKAGDIVDWLVTGGIIRPDRTDCVLGGDGTGYPPGPNYRAIVDLPVGFDDHTLSTRTNGLHVVTGRTVFQAEQGGMTLACVACGNRVDGGDAWSDAVGEWYEASGDGALACPDCGHAEPVTDWNYDPPWGFGDLGFEFWNWPTLKSSFVMELSQRLGHRTVLVRGKL